MEELGSENSLWKGRNFVFDSRGAASAQETRLGKDGADIDEAGVPHNSQSSAKDIVGKCIYCQSPWDTFDPQCVCTVCREPTLVCQDCQREKSEYHCKQHFHLRHCYFYDLSPFTHDRLIKQLNELETTLIEIAVGKRYKQKRKTLHKQCDKIRQRLSELDAGDKTLASDAMNGKHRCRNCDDETCNGRCWGFYSLKRKELLERKKEAKDAASEMGSVSTIHSIHNRKRSMKECSQDRVVAEMNHLKLCVPPSEHRDCVTAIRVPPPCTRVLKTKMKGKWNGLPVLQVVKDEFIELSKPGVLDGVLDRGLLCVNGEPVTLENAGIGLKTGDTISRVVHWHEPPVLVPERISVQKVPLPEAVLTEYGISSEQCGKEDAYVFVCNKPSSVPVHPAGPFLSNSLTMMVEAQENLPPQSLIPCHRTDRVTSGLTICCSNTNVARIIQRSMCEHAVQKLYLARVHGRFPSFKDDLGTTAIHENLKEYCKVSFVEQNDLISVDAPVETVDPANGIRKVTEQGKPSRSLFHRLSYDPDSDVSLASCRPITGRSHQLRVHLQLLGFPIVNDVLYGGRAGSDDTTKEAAIKALSQSTCKMRQELRRLDVTENEAKAAREACSLCLSLGDATKDATSAATSFFTSAQLLQNGHTVDLHAYWYRVSILPKRKKEKTEEDGNERMSTLAVLDLKVEYPAWADASILSEVVWLEEANAARK